MAQRQVAATFEQADAAPRSADDLALDVVAVATLLALGAGLASLTSGTLAWDRAAAVNGVVSQLGETLPAAILVLLATAANVGAGMVLARLATGSPFDGPARAVIAGTVGAVLLDAALLFALGGLGLFRAPLLFAVHAVILAAGWRLRPIVRPGSVVASLPRLPWALVVVPWLGVLALQLASPVVPFLDVLPNHVAPVERLRTFGEFGVLTETASPIYGPSRTFLGYTGLLGTIATMTGLPATLAVSAFILPGSILVAAGVHRLATAIGGPGASLWALIAFALTASFARMTDARATVFVLPVALGALAWVAERVNALESGEPEQVEGRARVRAGLLLGAALGAAVLLHPVVGALTVATVGIVVLIRPEVAPFGVPAIGVAAALALPQAATMLGIPVPSILALAAVVPALVLGRLLAFDTVATVAVLLGRAALLAVVPFGLAWADRVVGGAVTGVGELLKTMPLLMIGAVTGLVLAPRIAGHPVVLGGIAAGATVGALTQLVPAGGGTLTDSIRFELPKTLHYWLPVFAALATGLGLHALWRRETAPLRLRAAIAAAFLIVAAMPSRAAEIDDHYLGEHRFAETLAIDLRHAGRGYWVTYPDSRHVVDAPRVELLDAVRDEIRAGRIGPSTDLLHVAASFQQWVATPFGVFTGIRETDVSPDAEESIHTAGGRLHPMDQLDGLLAGGFEYVVLEPNGGVSPDARDRILAAGYSPVFANAQGELFARQ